MCSHGVRCQETTNKASGRSTAQCASLNGDSQIFPFRTDLGNFTEDSNLISGNDVGYVCAVPNGTRHPCLSLFPALTCRATDCAVPSGLGVRLRVRISSRL